MSLSNIDLDEFIQFVSLENVKIILQSELTTEPKPKTPTTSYIINLGNESNGGTHWVALRCVKDGCMYLDSFGAPPTETIKYWMNKHFEKKAYSDQILQALESQLCGWYCLAWLIYTRNSKNFNELTNDTKTFLKKFHDDVDFNAGRLRKYFFTVVLPKHRNKKIPHHLLGKLMKKIKYTTD